MADDTTKLSDREPVVLGALPTAIASVVLAGLSVFEVWRPTQAQQDWINGALIPLILALGTWFVARRKSWSPVSVARAVTDASAAAEAAGRAAEEVKRDSVVAEAVAVATAGTLAQLAAPLTHPVQAHEAIGTPPPVAPSLVGGRDPRAEDHD